jgi:hypothetical protein
MTVMAESSKSQRGVFKQIGPAQDLDSAGLSILRFNRAAGSGASPSDKAHQKTIS